MQGEALGNARDSFLLISSYLLPFDPLWTLSRGKVKNFCDFRAFLSVGSYV